MGLWRAKNQFLNNPSTSRKIVLLVTNDSNTAGFGPIGPANTLKAMGEPYNLYILAFHRENKCIKFKVKLCMKYFSKIQIKKSVIFPRP